MPLTEEEKKILTLSLTTGNGQSDGGLTPEERRILQSSLAAPAEGTLPVGPPSADPPYPYQEGQGLRNFFRTALNVPHDAAQVALNTGAAITSPIQTGKALGKTVLGLPGEVGNRVAGTVMGKKVDALPTYPESGMVLDDMKRRYLDEGDKTLTNEPVQTIMDILGLVQPGARAMGGTKAALKAQSVNPLKAPGGLADFLSAKLGGRQGVGTQRNIVRTRPSSLEQFAGAAPGRTANEAQAIRELGKRNNPTEIRNFHLAQQQRQGLALEQISESIKNTILERQKMASDAFREAARKWKTEAGEPGIRKLADGLNDVKSKLSDELRQFNMNVKGRAKLDSEIEGVRTAQQTPTTGYRGTKEITFEDMSREPYTRPVSGVPGIGEQSIERAKFIGQLEQKTVPEGPYQKPPSVQGKDLSGILSEGFKRTGKNYPDVTDAQLSAMKSITDKVLSLESPLPENIQALKNDVVNFIKEQKVKIPGTELDAFGARIVKSLDDLLRDNVRGYADLNDQYGAFLNDRQRIAQAFSLDADPPQRINALLDIYLDNEGKDFARSIMDELLVTGDDKIRATILGTNWERSLGEGLVARGEASRALRGLVGAGAGGAIFGAGAGSAGGITGAAIGAMVGAGLGAFAQLSVTSPHRMSQVLLRLGQRASRQQASKLKDVGRLLNGVYQAAKIRGIPIEGLTYGEILQRLSIPERAEQQEAESTVAQ